MPSYTMNYKKILPILGFLLIVSPHSFSQTWQSMGLNGIEIWDLVIDKNNTVYVTTNYHNNTSKVFRSTTNGISWDTILTLPYTSTPPNPFIKAITVNEAGDVFIGGINPDIQRSTNQGQTWEPLLDGFTSNGDFFAEEFFVCPNQTILTGSHVRISYMLPNSSTWIPTENTGDHHEGFTINSQGHIFSGSFLGNIYRSTTNGETWEKISTLEIEGEGTVVIENIATSITDSLFVTTLNGLWRSGDNGISWTHVKDDHPLQGDVTAMPDGSIFITGYNGDSPIQKSMDDGESWEYVDINNLEGSPKVLAKDQQGYLYIGTTNGLYRSSSPLTSVNTQKAGPILYQNYPNPFNEATTISFSLTHPTEIEMNVFDPFGKEVKTLIKDYMTAGNHTVQWDASDLPAGVYVCRLNAGHFSTYRKISLLR